MHYMSTNLSRNNDNEIYSLDPTVECYQLKIIGYYCVILFVTSFVSNTTFIITFLKNKSLLRPINIMILLLTISNLIGTLFQLPLVFVSAFSCK